MAANVDASLALILP